MKSFYPKKPHLLLIALAVLTLTACAKKNPPQAVSEPHKERVAETIARFSYPYDKVWRVTMLVLTLEYGLGVDVQDPDAGVIVTEWQPDQVEGFKSQFQVNVKISSAQNLTYVTIFKREEVMRDGRWMPIASNYQFEKTLLESITKRLDTKNQRIESPSQPNAHRP